MLLARSSQDRACPAEQPKTHTVCVSTTRSDVYPHEGRFELVQEGRKCVQRKLRKGSGFAAVLLEHDVAHDVNTVGSVGTMNASTYRHRHVQVNTRVAATEVLCAVDPP
jgi:hypothetical protein